MIRELLARRGARHVAACTAVIVVLCGAIAGFSIPAFQENSAAVAGLDTRTHGRVARAVPGEPNTAEVTWRLPTGATTTARIPLTDPPSPGARTEIAYDPRDPHRAAMPGAAVLAELSTSATALGISVVLGTLALLVYLGLLAIWLLALRREPHMVTVRRIRLQRGLNTRSWLETEQEPRRWIPVHFDPRLMLLPTPSEVMVRGDVRRHRLVAVELEQPTGSAAGPGVSGGPAASGVSTVAGTVLLPAGLVRTAQPKGNRRDNPSEPDEETQRQAQRAGGAWAQFRTDAPRLVITPLVGMLWVILDGGFLLNFILATAIAGSFSMWIAALRGSDPS